MKEDENIKSIINEKNYEEKKEDYLKLKNVFVDEIYDVINQLKEESNI